MDKARVEEVITGTLAGKDNQIFESSADPANFEDPEVQKLKTKKAILLVSATPRTDKHGDIIGLTLVGCDLTEVTAFQEAEERKVRFMAVVSHELRSPLHGIIGLMDHLLDAEEDKSKVRFLTLVNSCANRLFDLVVNIMEMASMASSQNHASAVKRLARDP